MNIETKEDEAASAGTKRPFSDGDDKGAPDGQDKTAVPAPKAKKTKKKHMDPSILRVRGMIQHCCATDDLMTAIKTYDKAIVDGTRIEAQSFYNLLNLCDGLQHRGIHIGTPKPSDQRASSTSEKQEVATSEVDLETRQKHAFRVKRRMDEMKIPLTETAYTALVKVLCRSNQVDQVEEILDEAEAVQQCRPKLRLYTPLLVAYSEMGQMLPALNVWLRLSKQELLLTEKEYLALIRCATKVGNAIVMERVLSYLSEDVLVPSRETSRAIIDWFKLPCAIESGDRGDPSSSTTSPEILSVLKEVAPQVDHVTSMGPVQCKITEEWTMSEDCQVDTASGILPTGCLEGESLQPIAVSASGWEEMKKMNETIVVSGKLDEHTSQYQGGRKGPKRALGNDNLEERKRHWKAFNDYLERLLEQKQLDVVIDGANIGYYEQNFAGAPKHVDYRQIDWVVQHCLRLNKTVLLFLHSRHFSNKLMPRNAEHIVRAWREAGILYSTPPGMNDDWFWMHAALQFGPGTLVLTNDEMRDHHFQMLAPRSFVRWKDRHQIHFGFGNWEKDVQGRSLHRRQVDLVYPEIYSRRMQRVQDGLVVPRPKRGDENRFLDGSHTATDDEPIEERYVCIRPKSKLA